MGTSVLMAVLLRPSRPPHWAMLAVMVSLAFILSIVWLNIIANEVVGVLTSLGLLLNIKTGLVSLAVHACVCVWGGGGGGREGRVTCVALYARHI